MPQQSTHYPDVLLTPDTDERKDKIKTAGDGYWSEFERMQTVFRECVVKANLPENIQVAFFQSVTVSKLLSSKFESGPILFYLQVAHA